LFYVIIIILKDEAFQEKRQSAAGLELVIEVLGLVLVLMCAVRGADQTTG